MRAKFTIWHAGSGFTHCWHWHLQAANGEIVLGGASEGYWNAADMVKTIKKYVVRDDADLAKALYKELRVHDLDEDGKTLKADSPWKKGRYKTQPAKPSRKIDLKQRGVTVGELMFGLLVFGLAIVLLGVVLTNSGLNSRITEDPAQACGKSGNTLLRIGDKLYRCEFHGLAPKEK